jgi:hypothetical protein
MISDKVKENMQLATQFSFYTVAAFIIMYFAASYSVGDLNGNSMTGMAISDPLANYSPIRPETCNDGTPLYECSLINTGNMCKSTKTGPSLRYSEKCYE